MIKVGKAIMKSQKCGHENEDECNLDECNEESGETKSQTESLESGEIMPPPKNAVYKRPVYKKWWFLSIVAAAIIAIITLVPKLEKPDKELAGGTTIGPSTTSWQTTTGLTTINDETTNYTPPAKESFGLLETAVFETLKITVNEIEESNGNQIFLVPEGNIFVGIKLTIENVSDKDQIISSLLLFSAYVEGEKYGFSVPGSILFAQGSIDGTIAPGNMLVGWYATEVPKNWTQLELHVKPSWLESDKAIFIFSK